MNAEFWQERLNRCPTMRPWLTRAARFAVTAEALPATLTLGAVPDDKAVVLALQEIFPGCRAEHGRLKARLDPIMRERERWLPLAELLGVKPAAPRAPLSPEARLAQTLQRLKILFPDDDAFLQTLRRSDQLLRFMKTGDSAESGLVALVEALLSLRSASAGITLSELGAKFLNDSKALRNGPLRQQFEHLLRLYADDRDSDATELLNTFGVIENPYTTHAVVFVPFSYRSADGEWLDWPYRLWLRGEAAILSWRTVRTLSAVRIEDGCHALVTSENAAPFHRLVETRRPALYTEGYPNAAVKALLRHFAQAGLTCLHWGDTDLDGYRIAEQVARHIATELLMPPAAPARTRYLRLTAEQHRRLTQFIDAHPEFPYMNGLRDTLSHGWLEQEQTIDLFTPSPASLPNSSL